MNNHCSPAVTSARLTSCHHDSDRRRNLLQMSSCSQCCQIRQLRSAALGVTASAAPPSIGRRRPGGVGHLLADGYDIRAIQELLGHKDIRATMIYAQVLNRGGSRVGSPADGVPAVRRALVGNRLSPADTSDI